jgi:hypothetical protein
LQAGFCFAKKTSKGGVEDMPSWEALQAVLPWLVSGLFLVYTAYTKWDDRRKTEREKIRLAAEATTRKEVEQDQQKKQTNELAGMIVKLQEDLDKKFDEFLEQIRKNQDDIVQLKLDYSGMVQMVKSLHKRVDAQTNQKTYDAADYEDISKSMRAGRGEEN